jgi:hypothetical protein
MRTRSRIRKLKAPSNDDAAGRRVDAEKRIGYLRDLTRRLKNAEVGERYRGRLQLYRAALAHEITVLGLVRRAARDGDLAAAALLEDQNQFNHADQAAAASKLKARGCASVNA